MASIYFGIRSDVTDLEKAHYELAKEFKELHDVTVKIVYVSHTDTSRELRIVRRHEVVESFDRLPTSIRSTDEFNNLLLNPSPDQLKGLGSSGPIFVLNVSRIGSDAFLITHNNIRHLPLSKLAFTEVQSNTEKLLEILATEDNVPRQRTNAALNRLLRWLSDAAIESILTELGFTEIPGPDHVWPCIWRVPVGRMSLFPIHAAGHDFPASGKTVISSYTSTVRALDYSRDQIGRLSDVKSQTALLINVEDPEENPLTIRGQRNRHY